MSGQNSEQVTVALAGNVYVGNFGTPLPTDLDTPDAGFVDLGYTSENGVTFTVTPEVEDINAWQKADPIRRLATSRLAAIAFEGLQWNQDSFGIAFGGGTWTEPEPGIHRYEPPADEDPLAEHSVAVHFVDGDAEGRVVLRKANVVEAVETQLVRNTAALLPVTFSALTPDDAPSSWYFLGNDEIVAEGS